MKLHIKEWKMLLLASGVTAMALTGCGSSPSSAQPGSQTEQSISGNGNQTDGQSPDQGAGAVGSAGGTAAQTKTGTVTVTLANGVRRSITYKEEDLDGEWDEGSAVRILLEDGGIQVEGSGAAVNGNVVTIQKSGTYVVSGSLSDGQICIDADKDTVHLVLDGVTMANSTTAPIYRDGKGKTILTLAAGSRNVIEDGTAYQYAEAGQDEPDAPLFFKGDLTINGSGELEVAGNYQCGIRSKENLLVASGTIRIRSVDDGLKGKESVVIRDGVLDIQSGKDGIKSNQDQDDQAGYVWIDGGTITIAADDDGIQAETALIVNGGVIQITRAQEALAGKTVDILDGQIRAQAEDDGINAAMSVATEQEKMQNQAGVYIRIAGGEIYLNAMADGIDSNGNLYIEGGNLYLTGPSEGGNGILDYNGDGTLTGGVVFAAGTAGMIQTFGEDSTQNYLVVYYEDSQEAGTRISLVDAEGQELGSFAPEKRFEAVIISVPELTEGSSCQVVTGENTVDITVEGIRTTSGTPASGGRGMGGHRGMGWPEDGERPERGMRPEGQELPEDGERPQRGTRPEGAELPEDGERPQRGTRPEGTELPEDGERSQQGTRPEGEELPEDGGRSQSRENQEQSEKSEDL
ncbi:MAG: carbohydrate-binding domain-containing protein [Lachnospiraceae bacterium]|nr:carbohydrate-binding domain-containing protein [Lachnospiraceae bacterium]